MNTVKAAFFIVIPAVFLTGLGAQAEGWQEDKATAKSHVYDPGTKEKSIQPMTSPFNISQPGGKPVILSPPDTGLKPLPEQPLLPPRPVIADKNEPKEPTPQNVERPPAVDPDIYEYDDIYTYAQLFYPAYTNQVQYHSVHTAYNEDWYLFYGHIGNTYVFYSMGSTDMQVWLYDNDAETQLDYDDDDGEGTNYYLEFTPYINGFYYLKVMGYGSNTGYYDFNYSYNTNPDAYEADDTAYSCTALTPQPYAIYQIHTMHNTTDQDWFMFYGLANVTYNFWSAGNTDVSAWLFMEDGTSLLAYDDDGGGAPNFSISHAVPADGWYKVQVMGWSGAMGPYDFYYTYNNFTDYYEPDNTSSQSSYLPLQNEPYALRHTICPEYDEDWFRFYGVANWTYQFSSSYNTDTMIELYEDDGVTLIASNDDGGGDLNFLLYIIPTTSSYYKLKVRGYGANTGAYDFHFQLTTVADYYEPNDSPESCTQFAINNYATGNPYSLHTHIDQDWFQFYGLSGLNCNFWSTGVLDTQAWLYQEDGTTQLAYDDDSGEEYNFSLNYTLPADGWYKLKITSWGGSLGLYEFYHNYSAFTDPYEPDNSIAQGRGISPSISISTERHSIYPTVDEDWFYFYGSTGINYEFYSSFTTDTRAEIYAGDGITLIASNEDGPDHPNFYLAFEPSYDSIYYLKISAYYYVYGVYDFHYRLWVDPDVYEPDNSVFQYTGLEPVPDTQAQSHTLHDNADDDWFSFLGVPGRHYVFCSTGTSDTEATLFNADGSQQLAWDDESGGNSNFLIDFSPVEYAIYKLKVNAWGHVSIGAYGFNYHYYVDTDAYEPDSQAQPVALTVLSTWSTLNRTVHYFSDEDWHRFEGVAGRTYTFESGGFTDVVAYLYDDAVSTLITSDDDGTGFPNFSISFTPAATAHYRLLVLSAGTDLGFYELNYIYESGALSPPANLAVAQSGGLFFISWDAVPGATSYRIETSSNPYTGFTTAGVTEALSWATLLTGSGVFFRVIALN